jgi:C4-dicarboxylate-specific signal transduction histidine kinase
LAIVAHEAQSRQVRLRSELCDDPCLVLGDQILLQQVVVNLLMNAMDAVHDTPTHDRRVVVHTLVTMHAAEVKIQDDGEGISDDIATRLFEPFVTTKAHGMGVGLAIVRSIVEAHGGVIHARNNPDGGATFTVTLPRVGIDSPVTA